MANSRLRQPSPLSLQISEWTYRLVGGLEFFRGRMLRRNTDNASLSRTQIIEQIVRSQGCHCGGHCAHCRHIINDVLER